MLGKHILVKDSAALDLDLFLTLGVWVQGTSFSPSFRQGIWISSLSVC